jgi:hypothetical protein
MWHCGAAQVDSRSITESFQALQAHREPRVAAGPRLLWPVWQQRRDLSALRISQRESLPRPDRVRLGQASALDGLLSPSTRPGEIGSRGTGTGTATPEGGGHDVGSAVTRNRGNHGAPPGRRSLSLLCRLSSCDFIGDFNRRASHLSKTAAQMPAARGFAWGQIESSAARVRSPASGDARDCPRQDA